MIKSWIDQLTPSRFFRRYQLHRMERWCGGGLIAIGLTGMGWGVMMINQVSSQADQISCIDQPASALSQVVVEVSGAVKQPGVYSFVDQPRTGTAIDQAGGLTKQADQNYVAHQLNLAQKVSDGSKLYIPYRGEIIDPPQTVSNLKASSLTSLNKATVGELESLPEIGTKRAEEIIKNRPFTQIDELVTKKIVSAAVFEGIKDQIQL